MVVVVMVCEGKVLPIRGVRGLLVLCTLMMARSQTQLLGHRFVCLGFDLCFCCCCCWRVVLVCVVLWFFALCGLCCVWAPQMNAPCLILIFFFLFFCFL